MVAAEQGAQRLTACRLALRLTENPATTSSGDVTKEVTSVGKSVMTPGSDLMSGVTGSGAGAGEVRMDILDKSKLRITSEIFRPRSAGQYNLLKFFGYFL